MLTPSLLVSRQAFTMANLVVLSALLLSLLSLSLCHTVHKNVEREEDGAFAPRDKNRRNPDGTLDP